ncbi:hypothetical protein [Dendronalium sp. ChiSLP03b]|uniref:hypothetical protein n=1 Tax=Dendronalium sp. ChiSLP03b TaxID=3075381 RepID=UPI002AD34FBF|nr:hypothetical protein [Dendronalium sp. ChiSLP03b]MDZ8208613.1 hypothetical protein [Dendronalium sp. ChiSLP03b]
MDSQSQIQSPPDTFLTPLLSLRDYYAPLVEKYEKLYTQALDNLNHVEALLSNWSSSSITNGKLETMEAGASVVTAPIEENLLSENSDSITEAEVSLVEPINSSVQTIDLEESESSQEFPNLEIPSVVDEVFTAAQKENRPLSNSDRTTEVDLVEPIDSEVKQTPEGEINEGYSPSGEDENSPALTSTGIETSHSAGQKPLKFSDIPMLSEYRSISRTEAVQKLLEKYAGTVCHIDFIVRSLYGELEPDVFKVVKGRVQSTLTNGRESNRWFLVPGKPGCFTLDLKLLNSNRKSSSDKQSKSKNNKPDPRAKTNLIPMLGKFEGQFLIDALTSLLQQNPLQVFNVAEVIEQLYGELDESDVREVKPKVLNELSRGHRTGRFSRVPNEIGLYTWDSKLLQQTSAG